MNRKGSILDLYIWFIILFVVGISILVATLLKDNIFPEMKGMMSSQAGSIFDYVDYSFNILDSVFVVVAVGVGLGAVILAFVIKSPPAFLFLSIILFVIALVVMPVFSNTFRSIAASSDFSTIIESYPMTKQIMAYLPLFGLGLGFLILLVTYSKLGGRD